MSLPRPRNHNYSGVIAIPVITVLGEIEPEKMGITAPHEHIFIDCRKVFDEFELPNSHAFTSQKVNITNLGILRRNHRALKDNLYLSEPEIARRELQKFKQAGGKTIVELSTGGMGREPLKLKELSRELGINIIAGCGFYKEKFHPDHVRKMSEEELAEVMISEIQNGMDGTDIRAGVIGEIGTSHTISGREMTMLKAAAAAQMATGAPLSIHLDPWARLGLDVLDILKSAGADLSRTVICHVDAEIDLDYCIALVKRGALIEFDNFGKEYCGDLTGLTFSRDIERVRGVKKMIDLDFTDRLLVSTDICLKTDLRSYGGWGYDHILSNMVPVMIKNGISEEHLNTIMRENPQKLFNMS
ncbi:MAG: TatD family hydrolase [Victivallales bacterium]|nr:TatD family hydrolase [Victivallales bacterium]